MMKKTLKKKKLLKFTVSNLPLTVNELCSGLSHLYVVILVSAPLQPTLNIAACEVRDRNRE